MAAIVIPGISVAAAQFLSVSGIIITLSGLIMYNLANDPPTPPCPPFPPIPPCPPKPCNGFFSCLFRSPKDRMDPSGSDIPTQDMNGDNEFIDNSNLNTERNGQQKEDRDKFNREILNRATEQEIAQNNALILIIVGCILFVPMILGLLLIA